jgi:hypothetical protein
VGAATSSLLSDPVPDLEVWARAVGARVALTNGDVELAEASAAAAAELVAGSDDRTAQIFCAITRARVATAAGRPLASIQIMERLLADDVPVRSAGVRLDCLLELATAECRAGRGDPCRQHAREALELARTAGYGLHEKRAQALLTTA